MVQVLPGVPTFGDKLSEVLGQAGVDIGEGLATRSANNRDEKIMEQLRSGNLSPTETIAVASKLSSKTRAAVLPSFTKVAIEKEKNAPTPLQQEQKEKLQGAFNSISSNVNKGTVGHYFDPTNVQPSGTYLDLLGPFGNMFKSNPYLNRESATDRQAVRTAASQFEAALISTRNKGALSDTRFKYLQSLLPDPDKSDRANKGALQELAREFSLDPSLLEKAASPQGSNAVSGLQVGESLDELPSANTVPPGTFFTKGGYKYTSNGKKYEKTKEK